MIYYTVIARIVDGLPLVASMQDDQEPLKNSIEYQSQAKHIIRKLNLNSPSRCSLVSDAYMFHYLLENGICYLILTSQQFSRTKSFSFLEDIQREFWRTYQNEINQVSRPYAFIEFDRYIQSTQRSYSDSRSSSNVNQLNVALQDVQRIMVQNIDVVLQRGEALSDLDQRASNLSSMSRKYQKDAHSLNLQSVYAKYVVLAIIIIVLFGYIYFRFLW